MDLHGPDVGGGTRGVTRNRETSPFGERLRWWRERRGMSQLNLAGIAATSQRHVSFLESGRTAPSREMVLRLAAALDVPLRQQNALLLAAGYAPAWGESELSAPELAKVASALDHMLAQQEPYPAFVVDRRWTLLRTNAGGRRLIQFLTERAPARPPDAVNVAEAMLSPDALRPFIANWEEVALGLLRSIQADALEDGTPETAGLLQRLLALPDLPTLASVPPPEEPKAPVLEIHFRRAGTSIRLFTTVVTLGTPRNVTVQEIRVECFFPADDETARTFRAWAHDEGNRTSP